MYKKIILPILFLVDAEKIHNIIFFCLKILFKIPLVKLIIHKIYTLDDVRLEKTLFGIKFKNPVGLAAGFDKSAEVYNSLFKFGFGFIEVGTVTPKRQLGNPKPRIFRLEKDQALINRLGFNNHGSEIIFKRISENQPDGFLGINIGKLGFLTDIDFDSIRPGMLAADVIVNPPQTYFLDEAGKRGAETLQGLGMVVNQAVIGIKYWTGVDVDAKDLNDELLRVLGLA